MKQLKFSQATVISIFFFFRLESHPNQDVQQEEDDSDAF